MSADGLPADLYHLLSTELSERLDFSTLYNCVVSSKQLASAGAVTALYRYVHWQDTTISTCHMIRSASFLAFDIFLVSIPLSFLCIPSRLCSVEALQRLVKTLSNIAR